MLALQLPARGVKRGGVAHMADALAQGLCDRGHEVTVWSGDDAPPGARYSVRPLPFRGLLNHWLGLRLCSGYLANFLALLPDYGNAEVIVAHGDSLLLPLRGIPVLRVMHGSALDEAWTARSPLRALLQAAVYPQEVATSWMQPTVAIGEHTRKRYPAARWVIPNGIDLRGFSGDVADKSASPSILFVGTLGGRKRGQVLLDWFSSLIQPAIPEAVLWMVSEDGPARAGVSYFPGASRDTLLDLYRKAWVLAAPSTYEGFGLPYVEAMAGGAAVVATANPGSEEVLDGGRYGCLITRDADFPSSLLDVLTHASLRQRYAELGRQRAREFSLDRMVDRYEAVLMALVGSACVEGAHA